MVLYRRLVCTEPTHNLRPRRESQEASDEAADGPTGPGPRPTRAPPGSVRRPDVFAHTTLEARLRFGHDAQYPERLAPQRGGVRRRARLDEVSGHGAVDLGLRAGCRRGRRTPTLGPPRGPHRPSRPASPAGPSGVPSGAVRDWPSGASGGSVLRPRLVRGPVQRRPKLGTARPARPAVRSTVRDKSAPSEARPRPVRSPIPAVRGPSEAQSGPVRGPSAAPFFASGGVSDGRPAGRDGRWGPLHHTSARHVSRTGRGGVTVQPA